MLACVGAVYCLVVRVRAFAPGLRAAGTVVALGHRGVFLGVGAIVVGGFALHFVGLGAEHGILFRFRFAVAVLGIVLRTGLFAAVVAVLGIVVRFGIDLGFRQIERRQQLSRCAGEGCLVVLSVGHLRQRLVGGVAQGVTPQVQHAPCAFRRRLSRDALAGQQRQRLVDRQLIFARHAVVAFGLALLRQLGAEIGIHAVHEA